VTIGKVLGNVNDFQYVYSIKNLFVKNQDFLIRNIYGSVIRIGNGGGWDARGYEAWKRREVNAWKTWDQKNLTESERLENPGIYVSILWS
jgi:hypothetical protein